MASDGCLSKDGRHLDLTSVDVEQLHNFCTAFGREIFIGTKQSGSSTTAFRIQFSDVAFYDFLLQAGLTPAKSHTLGSMKIPEKYYADFLRGLFDGDGTTYGFKDLRWKNSFMFYLSFAGASRQFLEYIQRMNKTHAGTLRGSIRLGARVNSLTYAKTDSITLAQYMYYRGDLPWLARKKAKLDGFIKAHQDAILS